VRKEGCSESGKRCSVAALLRKYERLIVLRRRRDVLDASGEEWPSGEGIERKAAFRELAEEFPGALRELELPVAVLQARAADVAAELATVEAGGRVERVWVRVAIAFHHRLAEMLAVKIWLARRIGPRGQVTDEVIAALAAFLGRAVSREELETLHHPPGGRVVELVWRELEEQEGMSGVALREMLFGFVRA
jgi:hypothetical protein